MKLYTIDAVFSEEPILYKYEKTQDKMNVYTWEELQWKVVQITKNNIDEVKSKLSDWQEDEVTFDELQLIDYKVEM